MSTSALAGSRGQAGCTSSLLSPGGGQPCHFPLTLPPLSLFTLSHLSSLKLCHLFSLLSYSKYSVTLLPLQIVQCRSFGYFSKALDYNSILNKELNGLLMKVRKKIHFPDTDDKKTFFQAKALQTHPILSQRLKLYAMMAVKVLVVHYCSIGN